MGNRRTLPWPCNNAIFNFHAADISSMVRMLGHWDADCSKATRSLVEISEPQEAPCTEGIYSGSKLAAIE